MLWTLNVVAAVFLFTVVVTLQAPFCPVVHSLVPPEVHQPLTVAPSTAPSALTTDTVTVADQLARPELEDPVIPVTHTDVVAGGWETGTSTEAELTRPAASLTVRPTVRVPASPNVCDGF